MTTMVCGYCFTKLVVIYHDINHSFQTSFMTPINKSILLAKGVGAK